MATANGAFADKNAGTNKTVAVTGINLAGPNASNYVLASTAASAIASITPASSSTTITCPISVTYDGTAQTPCTAAVTGAGGLNTTATVTYANNTNAGTATADASFAGDANHTGSTATQVTFTIDKATSTTTIIIDKSNGAP